MPGQFARCAWCFGDDAYLIRESTRAIARVVFPESDGDQAIVRFPGSSTPLANVFDEVRTLPFFSRKRLVIVDDADPFISKHRKELEAYTDKPSGIGHSAVARQDLVSDHQAGDDCRKSGASDQLREPEGRRSGRLAGPAWPTRGSTCNWPRRKPGSWSN